MDLGKPLRQEPLHIPAEEPFRTAPPPEPPQQPQQPSEPERQPEKIPA